MATLLTFRRPGFFNLPQVQDSASTMCMSTTPLPTWPTNQHHCTHMLSPLLLLSAKKKNNAIDTCIMQLRSLTILMFALFVSLGSKAQFNNEWIDYSKPYYKFY